MTHRGRTLDQYNVQELREEPDLAYDDPSTPLQRPEGQVRVDPEFTDSVESLRRENKHIILETDDDDLVECTIKWLNMCNKNVQRKIMERVVKAESKEEQEEEEVDVVVEEEEEEPPDPKVPAPTTTSMECQTDESFLSGQKAGRSSVQEEPVPPEDSSEKEKSEEPKVDQGSGIQHDDTAPKEKHVTRTYYGQDITGNEDDSAFRKLKECFPDGYCDEWAGFYNQAYPASSKHRHMFWHVKYRKTMANHLGHWYSDTDDQLMKEYIARHTNQQH